MLTGECGSLHEGVLTDRVQCETVRSRHVCGVHGVSLVEPVRGVMCSRVGSLFSFSAAAAAAANLRLLTGLRYKQPKVPAAARLCPI